MPPNLDIRVLFCYSPEVLANTYYNLAQLEEDNQGLCALTQDMLRKNVYMYNVSVTLVKTEKVDNLQTQFGIHRNCLLDWQFNKLSECTLPETANQYPSMFPDDFINGLLQLKADNKATVLVLQALLCSASASGIPLYSKGHASMIGVRESKENVVAIGRASRLKGIKLSSRPTVILTHEFGHLMGCRHPKGTKAGYDSTEGNSHGHCIEDAAGNMVQGTIMSYAKKKVFYFSNPHFFRYSEPHQDKPCGILGESEAYKTVNLNIQKLAGIFLP